MDINFWEGISEFDKTKKAAHCCTAFSSLANPDSYRGTWIKSR